ncbi:MAG: hypothetical protein LBD28_07065 [Tannerellaceae bacterium]|jgi:hypothetical protein|nr:hypothetical protein [Tannerellaceae bacterium]
MDKDSFETNPDAYYDRVKTLITNPQEVLLDNNDCVLTYIAMRSMFEEAIGDIQMFCRKFHVFQSSFINSIEGDVHYPEEVRRTVILRFQEAVETFLQKGHNLIAIIDNPGDWEEEEKKDSYFVQLFRQYSSQINLRTPTKKYHDLLGITFFEMVPTTHNNLGAVRWEAALNNCHAIVSSSATMYRNCDKFFQQLKRFSKPI